MLQCDKIHIVDENENLILRPLNFYEFEEEDGCMRLHTGDILTHPDDSSIAYKIEGMSFSDDGLVFKIHVTKNL